MTVSVYDRGPVGPHASLFILRRLTPPRRFVAWLALVALLIHVAFLGLHQPPVALAAIGAPIAVSCIDHEASGGGSGEAEHPAPEHVGARCPFCTLVQGGKLLPPSPCLVFPPESRPLSGGPPSAEPEPAAILVAAHPPRDPPREH